jgi:uncharacterized protein involved in type VI secretion and phage assembly
VYKARLTLLSDTRYTYDDLSGILDTNVSLTISQILWDADTLRIRYLHGIVTAVATDGVFSSGQRNYYRYSLSIESELARLRYNARNGAYYRQSPVDAVEAVLNNNHIRARFPAEHIDRNAYSKRLMFNQNGISDLDFIGNILFAYGLSFTSIHPAPPKDAVAEADIIFSNGNSFPVPVVEYSDGREPPGTAQFDFIRAAEARNTWKMDAFHIGNAIGVDGIEVSATYPEFNYGNEEWKAGEPGADKRSVTYNRLFSGYERGTSKEEIDTDMSRILDARLRYFALAKASWTGKAANLLLMPGALFELVHFCGLDDESRLTALVTTAKTHVRAVWPEGLAVKTEAFTGDPTVETEFTCMNYAAGIERRFCGMVSQ